MRAILFDFGGTLDCPRHWLDRFVEHYRAAGIGLSRAELEPAFTAATLAGYRASESIRNCGLRELIAFLVDKQMEFLRGQQQAKELGFLANLQSPSMEREVKRRISDSFVEESASGLARSRRVVSLLANEFVVGVVSNFYGNLERILGDAGFGGIVTAVADSGRLGVYKPDVGIYEAALAMIGMPPRATMMIGDSLDKDCAPARRLGMRAVWLRHAEATSSGQAEADFTIDALEELEDLLCRKD